MYLWGPLWSILYEAHFTYYQVGGGNA
jgi:hypothetical protein